MVAEEREREDVGPSVSGRGAGALSGPLDRAGDCHLEGERQIHALSTTTGEPVESCTATREPHSAIHSNEGPSGPAPSQTEVPPQHLRCEDGRLPQVGGGGGACEVVDLAGVVDRMEERDGPARKKAKSGQSLPDMGSRGSEGLFERDPPRLEGLQGIADMPLDDNVPRETIRHLSDAQAHGDVSRRCAPAVVPISLEITKKATNLRSTLQQSSRVQGPSAATREATPRQEGLPRDSSSFRERAASSQDVIRPVQGAGTSFGFAQEHLRQAARMEGARQLQAAVEGGQPPNGSTSPSWDTAMAKLRNKNDKMSKVTVLQTEPTVKLKVEQFWMHGFWMPEVTHNTPDLYSAAKVVLVRYVFIHCMYKRLGFTQDKEFMQSGKKHFYGHFFPSPVVTEWNDIMAKDLKEIFCAFNSTGGQYYLGHILGDRYRAEASKLVERNPRQPSETRPDLLAFALKKREWNLMNTLYRCTSLYKEYVFIPSRNVVHAQRTTKNEPRDIFQKITDLSSSIRSLGQRG